MADRRPPKSCYNCGESGHLSRDCPARAPRRPAICYNCNKEGHFSRDCPEKKAPPQSAAGAPRKKPPAVSAAVAQAPKTVTKGAGKTQVSADFLNAFKTPPASKAEVAAKPQPTQQEEVKSEPLAAEKKETVDEPKQDEADVQAIANTGEEGNKQENTTEEKEEEKKAPRLVAVRKAADFSKVAATGWGEINLEAQLKQNNKNTVSKKIVVQDKSTTKSKNPRLKDPVQLYLTPTKTFSMYLFEKPNKGFTNAMKINCFMNVCLQSLLASPAFFNLLQALLDIPDILENLDTDRTLYKMTQLAKFFNMQNQIDPKSKFATNIINGERIFEQNLADFNPDLEQQDAAEFLFLLLDTMHEELKQFYLPQQALQPTVKMNAAAKKEAMADEEWQYKSDIRQTTVQENTEFIFEPSVIRDIFGGVTSTNVRVDGTKSVSKSAEPFYVLNLGIPYNCYDLNECLKQHFESKHVNDFMSKGKRVNATHTQLLEKLPNVLCLNLKRFVYTDRAIKKREHVEFDEILTISDKIVSPSLRLGVFNRIAGDRQPRYRLFSVVEHVGINAGSGHYICYSMDSSDNWKRFDDKSIQAVDIEDVLERQAYILFYELIEE